MFGFGHKKKEEEDLFGIDGEGKFPPAEKAFDEHTPLSQVPKPTNQNINNPNSLGDGTNPFNTNSLSPAQESISQYSPSIVQQNQNTPSVSSDKFDVIIAKLESLKSNMEVLNQRMINLEHKLNQQDRRW